MQKAFHQMGWKDEGGLLRHVVVAAWRSVTEEAVPTFPHDELMGIVRGEDKNKDGVIDLLEFFKISEIIVNKIESVHDGEMQNMIQEANIEATKNEENALDKSRRGKPAQALLPWGWEFVAPGSFKDTISSYQTTLPPSFDCRSLTCMAYFSAPRSLSRVHQIVEDYRFLCAADGVAADPAITDALTTMTTASLKFTHLENQNGAETFSEIEKLLVECSILYALDSKNPTIDGFSVEAIRIKTVKAAYQTLIDHVLGFLQTIDDAYNNSSDHIDAVRAFYKTTWLAKRMEARACLVRAQLATWHEVENDIQLCREWGSKKPQIADLAMQVAKSQNAIAKEELYERRETRNLIEKTLFPTESVIRVRIVSASILLKSKWNKLARSPNPMAVIHQMSRPKQFRTAVAAKTTTPRWTEQFIPICFGVGETNGIQIDVYDAPDKNRKPKLKDLLGSTTISVTDSTSSQDSMSDVVKPNPPNLTLQKQPLFQPFSGNTSLVCA